jgi:hypothetical protein
LIIVGEQTIRQTAQHSDIEIQFPHLASDGHQVVKADRGHHQDFGLDRPHFIQNTGEIGGAVRECLEEDQLQALPLGEIAGPLATAFGTSAS